VFVGVANVTVELGGVGGRLRLTEHVFVLGYPWGYVWGCDKCHMGKG
jgi:hypothetical protein